MICEFNSLTMQREIREQDSASEYSVAREDSVIGWGVGRGDFPTKEVKQAISAGVLELPRTAEQHRAGHTPMTGRRMHINLC